MSKTPKLTDGEAPKKRPRKTTIAPADGIKVVEATKTTKPRAAKAKVEAKVEKPAAAPVQEVVHAPAPSPVLQMQSQEERVRMRAYELYLRRGGQGGSPEQDWFQALSEVYGESVA